MENSRKERFWTGPIVTRAHAKKIIGRLVAALAIIAAIMALTFIGGADSSEIAAVVIFALLALSLKRTESPIVAAIALGLTTLLPVLSVVAGLLFFREGSLAIVLIVLGLAWGILPLACYRGFVATRALRKFPEDSVEDTFA